MKKIPLIFFFAISFFLIGAASAKAAIIPGFNLELYASGFNGPVGAVNTRVAGDHRLFIVEQGTRQIRIYNQDTNTELATPFLDVSSVASTGSERGLLGLAFDPNYATNKHFFIYYTDSSGNLQITRYTTSADANVANPASATPIINIAHPGQSNHNGGDLMFGPDGYLYLGIGDGGGGGDTTNNAQNKNVLLGKILRIDPNGGSPYVNPATNPFVGVAGADEIWATGVRNPWRFSFDRSTGDLWIADVGQGAREEVDFQAAGAAGGQNYEWNCFEGLATYPGTDCPISGSHVAPIFDYNHTQPPSGQGGCAITGGYVYRGSKYPALTGNYIFSDYCSAVFYTTKSNGGGGWDTTYQGQWSGNITTFGEDIDGEVYAVSQQGDIYRITADPVSPAAPVRDSGKTISTDVTKTITFTTSFSSIPRVFAQVDTKNGPEKVYAEVRNITTTSFDLKLREGTLYDGVHQPEEVAWYAVQITNNQPEQVGLSALDNNWQHINFGMTFGSIPKILVQQQTHFESDLSYVDIRNATTTGFDMRLEEAPVTNGTHVTENVAWTAFVGNSSAGDANPAIGNSNWTSVNFSSPYAQPPAVLAEVRSENDGDKVNVMIQNITTTGFQFRLEEDPRAEDGTHFNETLSWVAFPYTAPVRQSANTVINSNWVDIGFDKPFKSQPLVFGQILSDNGTDTIHLQIRNVTPDRFQARLEEDVKGGWDGGHTFEGISFLAMTQAGAGEKLWYSDAVPDTNWTNAAINFPGGAFAGTPKLFLQINTQNGTDTVRAEVKNVTNGSYKVRLREDTAAGWDGGHTAERVALFAFETPATGQTNTFNSTQAWATRSFNSAFGAIPHLLTAINSQNDADIAQVDVKNLTVNGFDSRLEEDPKHHDGAHPNELIVWYAW